VIVDTTYLRYLAAARAARAAGGTPQPIEVNVETHFSGLPGADLRATPVTVGETPTTPHTPAYRGFDIEVSRDSAEYTGMLTRLEASSVGGIGVDAAGDRGIVADAFYARKSGGGPPTFVTSDRGLLQGLLNMEMARLRVTTPGVRDNMLLRQILDPGNRVPAGRTPTVYDAVNLAGQPQFTVTDPVTGRSLIVRPIGS